MNSKTLLLGAAAAFMLSPVAAMAERGSSGHLNIIYWQAPSTLNPYLSGGTKEVESASLVLESFARFDDTGTMVPWLAADIPTVENGGVSEDLTQITWTIADGITWSDGTPLTAADAVFTWEYCTHPEGGCAQASYFDGVESVVAVDDMTVQINFNAPKPFPYTAFVGSESPIIQAAQFAECLGARAPECTDANFGPIGTGPFVVTDFRPNDVIEFEANQNFRYPDRPYFATVTFKGGGDAAAAARSVLETGEFDYAWNLQIDPTILAQMEAQGNGTVVTAFGTSVERLHLNQTNPDPALGDLRSTVEGGPHPFLTDPIIGQAMSMAIDRALLVEVGYGAGGQPTCNVLPAPELYASTANDDCLVQDIAGANALLDEAGYVDTNGDGIREANGIPLSVLYQTSTNAVRQDTQALVKQWWSEIGIDAELRNIDASVFFGGDPASPDTFQKFYADVEMYTNNFAGVDPEAYMANWRCSEIPGPDTQWQGSNIQRFCMEEYDALVDEMATTADLQERGRLAREMNDMIIQSYSIIPLIHRGGVSAHANSLEGIRMSDWDSELWNIMDWRRAE
ncbi:MULTISPECIES: peptide ABC transporter substrate-binding protein [Paracoccaceae]|jgi:peptide/nickel transport system substrate-binding protein|uniref:peptide ABC transporter substrate-binding protein n=1 Tax=Rhodobacterales TaxID=204455 RepID=UPI001B1FFF2D|nr:peptide ABC transporter substrate-binding protein [Boseongicola sp. H5]MBO6601936.1 peptide ABC transporter substrate-binding protein [Roseicyclus sp.]MBO6623297.1 peptide ABC transporter substrate-binding protein [Roseicyclus sp.]MBO6922144.1 peptide ABC transporter substrate-binding protein [Roseicyclus sp.]